MITNVDKHHHLTARNRATISKMLEMNILKGGTKLIQYELTEISPKKYNVKIYERYAKASRNFDLRPESNIVKWHFESEFCFEIK